MLELRHLDAESSSKSRDLVGRVDHVTFREVRGWCADEADLDHHLTVEIFADNVLIGTAPCDEYRREIQDVLGGKGTFGFTFRFSASHRDLFQTGGTITAREQVTRRILGRAPSGHIDPRRAIVVHCDTAVLSTDGELLVSGWAVCAAGVAAVTVCLDGELVGEAELGLPRLEVAGEFPAVAQARHSGFMLKRRLSVPASDEHRLDIVVTNRSDDAKELNQVRLVVRDGLGDAREKVHRIATERARRELASAPSMQFRLEIDAPKVVGGVAIDPVTGRLTIEGWALARTGISGIEVMLDEQHLGDAHYGLPRHDVGAAYPEWVDSLRSGFAFHCPSRNLRNGDHVVQLVIRAHSGETLEHRFDIRVKKPEEFEEGITIRRRITQVEADAMEAVLDSLGHHPGFRLILRQYGALSIERLLATIGSLRAQVYRNWRLEILASDAHASAAVRTLIAEEADDLRERIDVIEPTDDAVFDQPIGNGAETTALRLVGCLLPGDRLGCDALQQIALASGLHRDADLLYADEVRISPASGEREPFFKPDHSPDLLLSTNYIGRPWFASTALLGRCGMTARDLLERGEYDVVLRCAELATYIHHVPKLLCQRGAQQIDDAETEAAALIRAAARRGIAAEVLAGATAGTWRFRRTEPVTGMVSIIVPTCAARGYISSLHQVAARAYGLSQLRDHLR